MKSPTSATIKAFIAVVLSVWFMSTSWLWVYFVNLIVSFPAGLVAFILWLHLKKNNPTMGALKIVLACMILGVASSTIFLILLLVDN